MMLFNANIQVKEAFLIHSSALGGWILALLAVLGALRLKNRHPKILIKQHRAGKLGLILLCSVVTLPAVAHEQHPNTLINAEELAAIRAKVDAGIEPWKSAYDKMISQANAVRIPTDAKGNVGYSVTYGGKNNCNVHQSVFCTERFYTGSNRYDWDEGAKPIGIAVRDLGMAYAFTGESQYADKLIRLVKTWALNPETLMQPRYSNSQSHMDLFGTMTGLIYGVDLAWSYKEWEPADKIAFKAWVKKLGEATKALSVADNNFENWRNALLSIAGAFTGDQSLLDTAFQNFRNAIPARVHWSGKMSQEYERTNGWAGLGYSMYAIHAMTMTAEVARHHNVDLYNYVSLGVDRDGNEVLPLRGLKTALDFHLPFVINPDSWTGGGNPNGQTIHAASGVGIYELAYSVWENEDYLAVFERWGGRPMGMNMWALGTVTLTHANHFDLNMSRVAPSITTPPVAITVTEGEDASFSVVASGSAPLTYQWFRGGVAIPGATAASYTLPSASPLEDGGKYFHVEVGNDVEPVVPAISDPVMLTVLADNIAPTLVSAVAASDTGVDIRFSEAVDSNSAGTIENYQIEPVITVDSASLSSDGRTVSLSVSRLTEETTYTVSVSHVKDQAEEPNTIVGHSSETFTYRSAYGFEGGADDWNPLKATSWRVAADNGDNAYHLKTNPSSLSGNRLGEYSLLPGSYSDFTFAAQARFGADSIGDFADYAVVFGYDDENNYDYVMFNNNKDETGIFQVAGGNRTALALENISVPRTDWLSDNDYHSIEVRRKGSAIKVYFDGHLIMSATDSAPFAGQVGVGSYNDTAYFDDVSISGSVASDLPLKITTAASLPNGQAGTLFSHTMTATGGSGSESYTWVMAEGSTLPEGLNLTVEGVLSGTPATTTVTVTYHFTIMVGDGSTSVSQDLNLTVNGVVAVEPLKITTASLPNGQAGTLFSHTMKATGGSGSEAYDWGASELPGWLDLDTLTGALSGTPATTSATVTYNFTITVGDGAESVSQGLVLIVDGVVAVEPLKITTASLPNGQAGTLFSHTMKATGGSGSEAYDWGASGLPGWLDLDTSTGALSGTPATTSTTVTYNFTITVGDGAESVSQGLVLIVDGVVAVEPLKIEDMSLANAQAEKYASYRMIATGGSGSYTWSADTLPAGLNLTEDGVLSGSPATTTTTTTYNFTIMVQDDSTSVTKDLNLTVLAVAASGGADSGSNGGGGGSQGPLGLLMLAALLFVSRRLRRANTA